MNGSKNVFFSYAWGDSHEEGESREAIVNKLYNTLLKDGYTIVRDNANLEYKGFISNFMQQIGRGNVIIVFISDKYVRSPYCMYELYEIARNSRFEKPVFREKIVPVLIEFIDFTKPEVIERYFSFWRIEQDKWEGLIKASIGQLSAEQYSRYEKVKLISQHFGQMVDWLLDMNTLNPVLLAENNFEIIKKTINSILGTQWTDSETPAEASGIEVFKTGLMECIENQEYAEVFRKIRAEQGIKYDKGILKRLENNFAFQLTLDLISQLKVFVGSISNVKN
jgi:hypothetical protein